MRSDTGGLADGTRVLVAGDPTEEETAAVLVALDAARRADAAARTRRPRAAWLRAARREAIGGRLVASPADLR
jgi:Xaa-Pro aminopeptidase